MANNTLIEHNTLTDDGLHLPFKTYAGDPNGNVDPDSVKFCFDTTNYKLYYNATASTNTAWELWENIISYAGDPNSNVTATRVGDLAIDTTTRVMYRATTAGGTVWNPISVLGSTILFGSGSPEGTTASTEQSRIYFDYTNQIIYWKTATSGNTGWLPINNQTILNDGDPSGSVVPNGRKLCFDYTNGLIYYNTDNTSSGWKNLVQDGKSITPGDGDPSGIVTSGVNTRFYFDYSGSKFYYSTVVNTNNNWVPIQSQAIEPSSLIEQYKGVYFNAGMSAEDVIYTNLKTVNIKFVPFNAGFQLLNFGTNFDINFNSDQTISFGSGYANGVILLNGTVIEENVDALELYKPHTLTFRFDAITTSEITIGDNIGEFLVIELNGMNFTLSGNALIRSFNAFPAELIQKPDALSVKKTIKKTPDSFFDSLFNSAAIVSPYDDPFFAIDYENNRFAGLRDSKIELFEVGQNGAITKLYEDDGTLYSSLTYAPAYTSYLFGDDLLVFPNKTNGVFYHIDFSDLETPVVNTRSIGTTAMDAIDDKLLYRYQVIKYDTNKIRIQAGETGQAYLLDYVTGDFCDLKTELSLAWGSIKFANANYAIEGYTTEWKFIDISDITAPSIVYDIYANQSSNFTSSNVVGAYIDESIDRAYLIEVTSTLTKIRIFDISTPSSWVYVGYSDVASSDENATFINAKLFGNKYGHIYEKNISDNIVIKRLGTIYESEITFGTTTCAFVNKTDITISAATIGNMKNFIFSKLSTATDRGFVSSIPTLLEEATTEKCLFRFTSDFVHIDQWKNQCDTLVLENFGVDIPLSVKKQKYFIEDLTNLSTHLFIFVPSGFRADLITAINLMDAFTSELVVKSLGATSDIPADATAFGSDSSQYVYCYRFNPLGRQLENDTTQVVTSLEALNSEPIAYPIEIYCAAGDSGDFKNQFIIEFVRREL